MIIFTFGDNRNKKVVKLLLIILLVFLVFRLFSRINVSSGVYTNQRNQGEPRQARKEGSVTLEKGEKTEKKINKDEGEYVDYEEIK